MSGVAGHVFWKKWLENGRVLVYIAPSKKRNVHELPVYAEINRALVD